MGNEYKSIEEKIFKNDFGDFVKYSVKGMYGSIASAFRLPTTIRKFQNEQLFFQREDIRPLNGADGVSIGTSFGGLIGFLTGIGFTSYAAEVAPEAGNYVPLAILGLTNLISGFYELGRLSKSKKEQLELNISN